MRLRLFGLGLFLAAAMLAPGCAWWRPCGCFHGRRCGYLAAPADPAYPPAAAPRDAGR